MDSSLAYSENSPQGVGPYSGADYRNGSDIQSDGVQPPQTFAQAYAAGQAANPVGNASQPWEGSVDESGRPIPLTSSQPPVDGAQQVVVTAPRAGGAASSGTFAFYGQPFVTRMPVIGSDWAEKNAVYAFSPDRSQAYWYSNGQLHTIPQAFKTPTFGDLVSDPSNPFMQHAQMGAVLLQGETLSLGLAAGIITGGAAFTAARAAGLGFFGAGAVSGGVADLTLQGAKNVEYWATGGADGQSGINPYELGGSMLLCPVHRPHELLVNPPEGILRSWIA